MRYDFSRLGPEQFEQLCAALIAAEGFRVQMVGVNGETDRGIDFRFESPDGVKWIGQAKLSRRNIPAPSRFRSALIDLQNGLTQTGASKALLIVSTPMTAAAREEFQQTENVVLWDADKIGVLLDRHPDIRKAYEAYIGSREILEKILGAQSDADIVPGSDLLAELAPIRKGAIGWRRFENTCVKILNYVFIPPLRLPKVQSRTHDGLDRRDAIYPIGSGSAFWDSVKHQHSSRMVVVEFKNLDGQIGQGEVESLQQYLLPKAKRSFGLLCSRAPPSQSAVKARRRAWMTAENLILFLSDPDLEELIRCRSAGEDPAQVLESQMDDFFITLAP